MVDNILFEAPAQFMDVTLGLLPVCLRQLINIIKKKLLGTDIVREGILVLRRTNVTPLIWASRLSFMRSMRGFAQLHH